MEETPNVDPDLVVLEVPQSHASEIYYDVYDKIDQRNMHRQYYLNLEGKFVCQDWSMQANMSILSMIFVDTWLVYNGAKK